MIEDDFNASDDLLNHDNEDNFNASDDIKPEPSPRSARPSSPTSSPAHPTIRLQKKIMIYNDDEDVDDH